MATRHKSRRNSPELVIMGGNPRRKRRRNFAAEALLSGAIGGATAATVAHHLRRKNESPDAAAIRRFEEFTGGEVSRATQLREPHMPAGSYAYLGPVYSLAVKPKGGGQVQEIKFEDVALATTPDGKQLYFVGGDQDISEALDLFGATRNGGVVKLGEARAINYLGEKPQEGENEAVRWLHYFGEEGGRKPAAYFDNAAKRILLRGGDYFVKGSWIRN